MVRVVQKAWFTHDLNIPYIWEPSFSSYFLIQSWSPFRFHDARKTGEQDIENCKTIGTTYSNKVWFTWIDIITDRRYAQIFLYYVDASIDLSFCEKWFAFLTAHSDHYSESERNLAIIILRPLVKLNQVKSSLQNQGLFTKWRYFAAVVLAASSDHPTT